MTSLKGRTDNDGWHVVEGERDSALCNLRCNYADFLKFCKRFEISRRAMATHVSM